MKKGEIFDNVAVLYYLNYIELFTKEDCYSENFSVTSKMKYDFKYVKEGNKMTDAMKELYDIFKEDIDQEVLEKSKSKWIKEGKKEGRKEGVINTLIMLLKDGIISVEDAAKRANLSVSKFQKYLNEKM